jgi:hypothetical protein
MEETSEGARNTGEPFWEVFRDDEAVRARVILKDPERSALLEMPYGKMRWRIFAGILPAIPWSEVRSDHVPFDAPDSISAARSPASSVRDKHASDLPADYPGDGISDITVDPLPYPLDGLLLYFLVSRAGDIMIHGSGIVAGGRGWLFTGRSGSGKTTLARIFDGAGDRVIHDDRLVLRREGTGWVMHNTPVYRNDEPRSASVDHLWVIRHGVANVSEPVAGAEAVAMIMANCIQQNWDGEAAVRLAAAADDLAASVPVSRLSFLPDGTIRNYLLLRATEEKILAAGVLSEMLGEGHEVTVTAGGYSMWPAIKPGDRVRISPPETENAPARGTVVALRRDGGFVVHRVTDVRRVVHGDHTGRVVPAGKVGRERPADHTVRGGPTDHVGTDSLADQTGRGGPADHGGTGSPSDHHRTDSPADQTGRNSPADHAGRVSPGLQIRTRGDTSLAADPWISVGDIAGHVTLVTAEGDTIPVPHRRFPYLAGSIAAAAAQIWNRIAGRK